jgi:hypothetical protein
MTNTGTGDGTVATVVKEPPTAATRQRTATVAGGGFVSTTALTGIIAYGFMLYGDAHPGFRTPMMMEGGEVLGPMVYGGIAAALTSIWQGFASFMMRGSLLILDKLEHEGADRP